LCHFDGFAEFGNMHDKMPPSEAGRYTWTLPKYTGET
jgi:hypothetical protein